MRRTKPLPLLLFAGLALCASQASAGMTADRVAARGYVICGIDQTPGFGGFDLRGRPEGFEVDLCRAVAAAVLKDSNAIRVQRVTTKYKFRALADNEIDIAFGMTTWTFNRDTTQSVLFPVVAFYDGQGFMTWSDIAPASLTGASVCVQAGTTSAQNLRDYLARSRSAATVLEFSSSEEKFNAFAERRCESVTGDRTELAAQKSRRAAATESWTLPAQVISREPLGPAVSDSDPEWFGIVRWSILATMVAEFRGIGQADIAQIPALDMETRRLKGEEPGFGSGLHLDQNWARRIIESVGNYGEIFARNLGPLHIARGQNELAANGGLLYAPPLK